MPLTVIGSNATRLYGAGNPLFTGTIAGLQNGDLISASFLALAGPTSPVGDYTITAGLSGAASTLDNYTLSITLGTLQVLPAPLAITANNAARLYGAANPVFTGTITGVQNGDNITATYTCSAGPTSAPGAYPIVPSPAGPGNLQTNYQVTLVNGTLTVLPANNPPAIVFQPTNQVVGLGQTAMFAVGATGPGPLSYQWQLNGANLADGGRIAGSQSNLLALAGVLLSDAGNYQALITNASGSVTSAVATLTIVGPPLLQAVAQSNATITLSWSATPGQSYEVQYATDLSPGDWTNLLIVTATSSTATASDALSSSAQRFYRILWSP